MATIHVNRGATNLGVFSEEEVREGLSTGRFLPNDLGWSEGMPSWKQLSQFPEFAAGPAPSAAPTQPAGESTITPAAVGSTSESPVGRTGLPWEHREERGLFTAFFETLAMVLTKPDLAFRTMRTDGGLGDPLLYAIIGGGVGVIVWFLVSLGLNSLGIFAPRQTGYGPMFGMTVSAMVFLWRLVGIAVAPFIFGGLIHLSLLLIGGARKTFETTFRVVSFSQGSTAPLQLVPCCGGLIALVWWLVANCIGVARAHEIDTGRAALAVFLPVIVCCGGGLVLAFMFGGFAALQHNWNH